MNRNEEKFAKRIDEELDGFKYISGYENNKSIVKLKCLKCNTIIERCADSIRKNLRYMPTCKKCDSIKRLEDFKEKYSKKLSNFSIYNGFYSTKQKTPMEIKCKTCGNIQTILPSSVTNRNNIIKCKRCIEIKKEQAKIKKQRIIKEKVLKGTQIQLTECLYCGILFYANKNNRKYCSDKCSKKHREIKRRIFLRKAEMNGETDYTITLEKLIKRDNNICYLCNQKCNLEDYTYINNVFIAGNYYPSIEHVVPLSKGGKHIWANVKLAHRICNSKKGAKYES